MTDFPEGIMEAPTAAPMIVLKKGARRTLLPFGRDKVSAVDDLHQVRLVCLAMEGRETVFFWLPAFVSEKPDDWANEVIDQVRQVTDRRGAKTDFVVECVDNENRVRGQYTLQAQPAIENLNPTGEGLTMMAMRHATQATQSLMADRAATMAAYQQTIGFMQTEVKRLQEVIAAKEARETEYYQRELKLLDRERDLLRKEAERNDGERENDRLDRVVDKIGEAAEGMGMEAVRAAIARMDPSDVKDLLEKFGPAALKMMGGN